MTFNDDMDLVKALSEIFALAWSHGHTLPTAIAEAQDRIQSITSDAMSYTLSKMVQQAKVSADETIAIINRR